MFFSAPKALRVPSTRKVFVPAKVRRKTNLLPSPRTVASKPVRRVTR
jgi:hypothetical protein